jgi:hypothetical protein
VTSRADQLLSSIGTHEDGYAANELLGEFFAGYPVHKLNRLLGSLNQREVEVGAWIASELGARAAPLLDELRTLLRHSSRKVRFFVLDSILAAATTAHGEAIARAVEMVSDSDAAVRWKAMHFLARASDDQLTASLPYLDKRWFTPHVSWLLNCGRAGEPGDVIARLDDKDPASRLFAAAAAARIVTRDSSALEYATGSVDTEVSSFARDYLRALGRRRA